MSNELNTDESQVKIRTGGYGTARCNLIKAGVYEYETAKTGLPVGFTDKKHVKIWYSAEELSKQSTLDAFKHNTLTIGHPESCDITTWKDITQGEVSTDITFKDGVISGTIIAKGAEAMAEFVRSDKDAKHQLSAGIKCGFLPISGTTDDGQDYDLKAVDIGSDHVAMCVSGKAGDLCRVLTDSEDIKELRVLLGFQAERMGADAPLNDATGDTPISLNNDANEKENDMADTNKDVIITLNNSELTFPDKASAEAVQKVFKALETEHANFITLNNSNHAEAISVLEGQKNELTAEIAQLKLQASPEHIAALAQERLTLMNSAEAMGVELPEAETKSPRELRITLLNSANSELEITDETTDAELKNLCSLLPLKLDNSADGAQKNDFSGKTVNKASDNKSGRKHKDALINACKPAQKGA